MVWVRIPPGLQENLNNMDELELHKFKLQLRREIEYLNSIVNKIEEHHLENDQEVLDWFDALNKISVKH